MNSMNNVADAEKGTRANIWSDPRFQARLRRRYASERRFKALGIGAITAALLCLVVLLTSITSNGYSAFRQTYMAIDVTLDASLIDPKGTGDPSIIRRGDFGSIVKRAMRAEFPHVKKRRAKRRLTKLASSGA
ncbi:MAG: DUF3333 domain-containing protein, partial [Chromatiales bacterium]|nr:DUF3333 domain-containing protein [Chromatiales bacterium]